MFSLPTLSSFMPIPSSTNGRLTKILSIHKKRCHHFSSTTSEEENTVNKQLSSSQPGALSFPFQEEAESLIIDAAVEVGVNPSDLTVEWSRSTVTVTVRGGLCLSAPGEEEKMDYDDDMFLDSKFDGTEVEYSEEGKNNREKAAPTNSSVGITGVARNINTNLSKDGEGSIGWLVLSRYEIVVTTPGSSDILEGEVMFEAFKGFDVIVEVIDTKKKKNKKGGKVKGEVEEIGEKQKKRTKIVEGKLVDRDDGVTIINIKGRMKKMKNEDVICVRLPKAKKEKRVK